LGKGEKE
jgi:hypothetical protein